MKRIAMIGLVLAGMSMLGGCHGQQTCGPQLPSGKHYYLHHYYDPNFDPAVTGYTPGPGPGYAPGYSGMPTNGNYYGGGYQGSRYYSQPAGYYPYGGYTSY